MFHVNFQDWDRLEETPEPTGSYPVGYALNGIRLHFEPFKCMRSLVLKKSLTYFAISHCKIIFSSVFDTTFLNKTLLDSQ